MGSQDARGAAARRIALSDIPYCVGRLQGMATGARYATEEDLRRIVRDDLPVIAEKIQHAADELAAAPAVPSTPPPERETCDEMLTGFGKTLWCELPINHRGAHRDGQASWQRAAGGAGRELADARLVALLDATKDHDQTHLTYGPEYCDICKARAAYDDIPPAAP